MNKEFLGEIIIENQDCFYRVAKTILRDDNDCKDAISQMIVKAFEKIHTLKKDEYAKTWLTRILINECYSLLRIQNRLCTVEQCDINDDINYDNYTYVYEAINNLPEKLRICVTLYYIEGFSIKEIAKMLDTTESAVKKRLVRARAGLKLEIEGGNA